jgi:hypothetical protein
VSQLPRISGREVVRALSQIGYERETGSEEVTWYFDRLFILIGGSRCPITARSQRERFERSFGKSGLP